MKRILIIILIIILLIAGGGYYYYKIVMPGMIADAVVSGSVPEYVPERIQEKIEKIRQPVNQGTEAMIKRMHERHLSLDDILAAVDNLTAEQIYRFLDDVNDKKPKSSDKVFDLILLHFPTKFDAEVFREPFNQYSEYDKIKGAITYANLNRNALKIDISTIKAIIKKILIEKEKEVRGKFNIEDLKYKTTVP